MTDDKIEKFFEGIISEKEELTILKLLSADFSDEEILKILLEKGED